MFLPVFFVARPSMGSLELIEDGASGSKAETVYYINGMYLHLTKYILPPSAIHPPPQKKSSNHKKSLNVTCACMCGCVCKF